MPRPTTLARHDGAAPSRAAVAVGGSKVVVAVCRPAVAVKDSLDEAVKSVLATKEPSELTGGTFKCEVDGKSYELTEGADYYLSTAAKARHNSYL